MSAGADINALRRLFEAILEAAQRDPALARRLGDALRGSIGGALDGPALLSGPSTPAPGAPVTGAEDVLLDCAGIYAAEGAKGLARRLRGLTKSQLLAIARSDAVTAKRGLSALSAPELVYRIVAAHEGPPDLVGRDFA